MKGRITRGTTLDGKALDEGQIVDVTPEIFHLFSLTKDIEPFTEPTPEPEPAPEPAPEPIPSKPKKKH